MPELPEVETLKRELARVLPGRKIKAFQSDKFDLPLVGRKIISVDRRAKILIFTLSGKLTLLVHLKMTGQLVYGKIMGGHPEDPAKYTRAIFTFTDNSQLFFNDLRKFGWLRLVDETELPQIFAETGVEPLAKQFTLAHFQDLLARYPKRKIKQLLLDQNLIAGLGNIYVDEACFGAGIRPTRLAKSLAPSEIARLYHAIIAVLKLAIQKKGTSFRNYRRAGGEPGGMVPHLQVYGRGKKECKVCGQPIEKIKLHGRGTHYCPRCQK
jgi:formamidopyrimidine-DNA glycosylase